MRLKSWLARAKQWRTGLALCIAGLLCVLMSWVLRDSSWPSGFLVEVGATFLLFGPLLLVQKRIERRIAQVQKSQREIEASQETVASEISALSDELADTRDQLRATHERLTDTVITRLAAKRDRDWDRFKAVDEQPSAEIIGDALTRAIELGLIPTSGCRVELFDTYLYVRFMTLKGADGSPIVPLILETQDGSPIGKVTLAGSQETEDVLVELGELVQARGFYPGDMAFDPGRIFADLRFLLELAHTRATGDNGIRDPLGRLVQLCPPQWAITEHAITSIKDMPYQIQLDRLNELDWWDHMHAKPWVDRLSFGQAFRDAVALLDTGRLGAKQPVHGDQKAGQPNPS